MANADRAALIAKLEDEKRRTSICGLERVWPALTEAEADLLLAALRDGPAETPAPQERDRLDAAVSAIERLQHIGIFLHHASGRVLDREEFVLAMADVLEFVRLPKLAVSHPAGAEEPR